MRELLEELEWHLDVQSFRENSIAASHTLTESDVLSLAASHSLCLRPILAQNAARLMSKQTKEQSLMQECSTEAAPNALKTDIKVTLGKVG